MDGSMHGMDGGMGMPSPSNDTDMHMHHDMMMHMTFFWGKNAAILFSGWPGSRTGMYALALIFVFVLAVVVEWLSHSRFLKWGPRSHVAAGLVQTAVYAIRVALAYMLMLALMSFNVGVFLVAVAGHAVGFLIFGSRVFKRSQPFVAGESTGGALPPMKC